MQVHIVSLKNLLLGNVLLFKNAVLPFVEDGVRRERKVEKIVENGHIGQFEVLCDCVEVVAADSRFDVG